MNHINKHLAFINITWRYSLIVLFFLNFNRTNTEEVGKLFNNGYSEDLRKMQEIVVQDNTTGMSEYIRVEAPPKVIEAPAPGVSIFFIIDNSAIMTRREKDRLAHRFSVIRDMVDTIKNNMPQAEVGLAVFQGELEFSIEDSLYFVIPPKWKRAYLKLLQLNKTYDNNQKGSDIIKKYLESELDPMTDIGKLKYKPIVRLPYNIICNTNINTGFDAAKHAMESSLWPKQNRFIVFISCKEANYPKDGTKNDFAKGIDVPTTFTIFFSRNKIIPQSIQVMTDNIAKNRYSASNPLSKAWGYDNSFVDEQSIAQSKARLSKFIMEHIIAIILKKAVNIRRTIFSISKDSSIRIKGGTRFELPKACNVALFNSQGRIIEGLITNGNTFTVRWPAGIYFLKADTEIYRFVISE